MNEPKLTPLGEHKLPPPKRNLPLPGMAAISCLLLLESGGLFFFMLPQLQQRSWVAVPMFLTALLMFLGGAGLLRQKRWGWAIALATAALAMSYYCYLAAFFRTAQPLIPAVLHLVFFFYLMRMDVRLRLR